MTFVFNKASAIPTDYGLPPAGDEDSPERRATTRDLVPVTDGDEAFSHAKRVDVFVNLNDAAVYMLRPSSADGTDGIVC